MNIIFYGSLRDTDVRCEVLGKSALSRLQLHDIHIQGHVEYTMNNEYIVFVPNSTQNCEITLAMGLNKADVMRLDFYENGLYKAQTLAIKVGGKPLIAHYYGQAKNTQPSGKIWHLEHWCHYYKPAFMPELKADFATYSKNKVQGNIACLSSLFPVIL